MAAKNPKPHGLLAQFDTASAIYSACEKIRDDGFKYWDAFTPFPVHGLDKAMGLKRSMLPWIVLVMGLTGASGGMLLQWWVSVKAYPLVISGKPLFSWQAYVPITFELGVLFGALGAVFGMFHLCRIPQHYSPLFKSERFESVTDDKFFIAIEAEDPKFHPEETAQYLESLGATHVEMVEQ
ncbi:MAG: DUF3341 domain-containing protein [Deltaproteobacteria bacterium]|nr:DUF3341 domain-containing protein [Deltaproteobacteria bacterium]MCB9478439.1 DUF3341 domain-containing protein [Deltaproteobacteria bacterium]MCB9489938.1 DUF3341 domain-containing protein [Deltaproteobacteria bacterium]